MVIPPIVRRVSNGEEMLFNRDEASYMDPLRALHGG
jgi:hypothetical protein